VKLAADGSYGSARLGLLALRFVWICGALRVSAPWAKWRGEPRDAPSLRFTASATLAGIRGAVTLASGRAVGASGHARRFAVPRA
jgi:NhaP-type Na+/H+ or K+/H+ antiporter